MTQRTPREQLVKYLTDVHSIELQALAQLKTAPEIAGDPELSQAFSAHLSETEEQERLITDRLAALGSQPAKVKDLVGTLTGKGFIAFARSQPDTPGKLTAHAFSYEHMEEAAYELLERMAQVAGDESTADVARRIREQERTMEERLAGLFDRAADAALREVSPDGLGKQLDKYLADAHAIEGQALTLLDKSPKLAGTDELAATYESHFEETEQHQRMIAGRLESRGASPSTLKDAALRLGALNWGAFFQAQPDTPAKLAAFSYAFEHLEIAGYELLARVARRAGDEVTVTTAERILSEERTAAQRLYSLLGEALEASLVEQHVSAR